MTKSIIITYNEADESFLMTLFKKFKIKIEEAVTPLPTPNQDSIPTKQEFLNDFKESILEMKAHQRGEIELPSFEESIKRIQQEIADEELISV